MNTVSAEQMQLALESLVDRLGRAYPAHYPPAVLAEVRAIWPLDRLMAAHAQVWFKDRVLTLQALSAYDAVTDPEAFHVDLSPDSDDAAIGAALLEVWPHSVALTCASLKGPLELPGLPQLKERHDRWLQRLMARHGFRTARQLLAGMRHCRANRLADRIELEATDHDRLDGWGGIPGLAPSVLPRDADARRLGGALRDCMARCLDSHGARKRGGAAR